MLQSLLGVGVVVYFDDILAYNYKNLEGHLKHLKQVFELLRMNKLYASKEVQFCCKQCGIPWKCTFSA
jgi:hypothetical protein